MNALFTIRRISHALLALLAVALLQACFWESDDPAPALKYTIGGTVSGLSGSGMLLQNNGGNDLTVDANGVFTFTTTVVEGGDYAISIKAAPSYPTQTCSVSNSSGKVAGTAVTDVSVSCSVPANQDASGIYTVGSANLNATPSSVDDLKGMIYNNRFLLFSIKGHVLYDGTITTITSTDFTATADVYENGTKTQSGIDVTGQVITESKITGTLKGTGKADGDFSLTFDMLYHRAATVDRFKKIGVNTWKGVAYSTFDIKTDFGGNAAKVFSGSSSSGIDVCQFLGNFDLTPDQVNIFTLQTINIIVGLNNCGYAGIGYDGFAAVIDGVNTDDTALMAFTNGNHAVFGVFSR